ncbi:hypothetical protein H0264_08335 [Nocardia huaxiensis]|uniref:Uncharacterized protein n=1 Tax=Nocardia huaxiensis TaxID=2755382 RepID=A0A7D6ZJ49_9NOCA|nr:hypothetical protein [Nocardia huaxiensis]QLY32259.1 hypothetical protein H0264_08335 [Nocardia huaxiensis]UFS94036.1 hypothetical protein LPY97_25085 [Nocardia huaxiensis]
MTEDANQLSVAELLARNGQQGAPSGGGGRRRRSGRGVSVAELSGEIPAVRAGGSSHAAPDDDPAESAPEPAPAETDFSNFSNFSNYSDYSNFSDYSGYSAPSAEPQPDYSGYSVPAPEPSYSPLSGPISYYDPERAEPQSLQQGGYGSAGVDWPPTETPPSGRRARNGHADPLDAYSDPLNGRVDPLGGSNPLNGHADPLNGYANPLAPSTPSRGGRRRKPDPLDSDLPLGELDGTAAPAPAPTEGGRRRRRFDPDDETTEVRPFRGDATRAPLDGPAWSPAPEAEPLPGNSRNGYGDLAPTQAAPATPLSRSARRHAEAQREEDEQQARLHEELRREANRPAGQPWNGSPAPQDDRAARDLDAAEDWRGKPSVREIPGWRSGTKSRRDRHGDEQPQHGETRGWQGQDEPQPGPAGGRRTEAPERPAPNGRAEAKAAGLPAWSARRRQSPAPEPAADRADQAAVPTAAWSLAQQDQQLLSGETVAGDLLRDAREREDERTEHESRRGGKRRAGGSRRRGAATAHPDPDEHLTDVYEPVDDYDELDDDHDGHETSLAGRLSAVATRAARRTRGATAKSGRRLSEDDENRRQWMILGGQSAGAAIAGMLLFKGFERMWELLPWVALALAMIVILGLVALVRVLRRTDDIFSTVIAVVVGVFVTLGPLAFLLSTN